MQTRILKLHDHTWSVQLRDDADESVANEIFKFREYRIIEPFLGKITHPILDIGAHTGLFSLYVRCFTSEAPIFAFEPEPENFTYLTKHIKENNLPRVTALQKAIGARTEKRKLVMTPDSLNHFLSPSVELFSPKETIEVEAQSLSDALTEYKISKIGLLKMDIEGGEYEVVDAIPDDVYPKIGAFLLEYHDNSSRNHRRLEMRLREHGFGVQTFPSKFEKSMGFIFARNKRV